MESKQSTAPKKGEELIEEETFYVTKENIKVTYKKDSVYVEVKSKNYEYHVNVKNEHQYYAELIEGLRKTELDIGSVIAYIFATKPGYFNSPLVYTKEHAHSIFLRKLYHAGGHNGYGGEACNGQLVMKRK